MIFASLCVVKCGHTMGKPLDRPAVEKAEIIIVFEHAKNKMLKINVALCLGHNFFVTAGTCLIINQDK